MTSFSFAEVIWDANDEECKNSWIVLNKVSSEFNSSYFCNLGLSSSFLRWHVSNNEAEWTFVCAYRTTCFLLLTFPTSVLELSRAFSIPCPRQPLHPESSLLQTSGYTYAPNCVRDRICVDPSFCRGTDLVRVGETVGKIGEVGEKEFMSVSVSGAARNGSWHVDDNCFGKQRCAILSLGALEPRVFVSWIAIMLRNSARAVFVGALFTRPVGCLKVFLQSTETILNLKKQFTNCHGLKNAENSNYSSSSGFGPNSAGLLAILCGFLGQRHCRIFSIPTNGCPFRCLICWLRGMVPYSSLGPCQAIVCIPFPLEQSQVVDWVVVGSSFIQCENPMLRILNYPSSCREVDMFEEVLYVSLTHHSASFVGWFPCFFWRAFFSICVVWWYILCCSKGPCLAPHCCSSWKKSQGLRWRRGCTARNLLDPVKISYFLHNCSGWYRFSSKYCTQDIVVWQKKSQNSKISVLSVGDQVLRFFAELVDFLRQTQILKEGFLVVVGLELLDQLLDLVITCSILLFDCRKRYSGNSVVHGVATGFKGRKTILRFDFADLVDRFTSSIWYIPWHSWSQANFLADPFTPPCLQTYNFLTASCITCEAFCAVKPQPGVAEVDGARRAGNRVLLNHCGLGKAGGRAWSLAHFFCER